MATNGLASHASRLLGLWQPPAIQNSLPWPPSFTVASPSAFQNSAPWPPSFTAMSATPLPNERQRNQLGSSQLLKFLLSSPLDHAPFLALSNSLIVDQGTVKDTPRHSTLCDKVFSTAKTRTALKPTDHPKREVTNKQTKRALLLPQQKAQAYCESLFTPFRTVIGGPVLGS